MEGYRLGIFINNNKAGIIVGFIIKTPCNQTEMAFVALIFIWNTLNSPFWRKCLITQFKAIYFY
jgi:hypothetical protein